MVYFSCLAPEVLFFSSGRSSTSPRPSRVLVRLHFNTSCVNLGHLVSPVICTLDHHSYSPVTLGFTDAGLLYLLIHSLVSPAHPSSAKRSDISRACPAAPALLILEEKGKVRRLVFSALSCSLTLTWQSSPLWNLNSPLPLSKQATPH